ncbi:MAG: macro domain-containing protein [Anaerolineae bacterium]|nr:macro domain-containing protein [Anaerolineae bacterium]
MITYVYDNLFESPAQVLVNTVNTVGVMGKGIALEFKRIYPEMFKQYQQLCERNQFHIGQLWLYKTSHKWILNFPTKQSWRQKSKPEYIEIGLQKFVSTYAQKGITSISFPMLGCGNGELDWETQVRPLMESYLDTLPITVYIHLYSLEAEKPEHQDIEAIRSWLQGEPQSIAFGEFWHDLVTLVQREQVFMALDTKLPFTARIDSDGNGIWISAGTQSAYCIARDDNGFLDLWQYIRSVGYCFPDKFPGDLGKYKGQVMGLLAGLSYIEPVTLALKDGIQKMGLQLVPRFDFKAAEIIQHQLERVQHG